MEKYDLSYFYRHFIKDLTHMHQYQVFALLFTGKRGDKDYWRTRASKIISGRETIAQSYLNAVEECSEETLKERFRKINPKDTDDTFASFLEACSNGRIDWNPDYTIYVAKQFKDGLPDTDPFRMLVILFKLSLNLLPADYETEEYVAESNTLISTDHTLSTAEFFVLAEEKAGEHGGIKEIDILLQSGADWWRALDYAKVKQRELITRKKYETKVLVNEEKTLVPFVHAMKVDDVEYISFDESIELWHSKELKYSNLHVRICSYPAMHRTYIVRYSDGCGVALVHSYVYGFIGGMSKDDPRNFYSYGQGQYTSYCREFDLLWDGHQYNEFHEETDVPISVTYDEWNRTK